ncbi:serine hydrolase domain-containing protein [Streptomyces xiangluensis]|uniref:Serine hydrolase domain-containing protein n=1 Tax=Streptomyces xiangluensis TaxID=2665720 RepID=A0ABV8Z979_9ACTN
MTAVPAAAPANAVGMRHPLFSPEWFACADALFAGLPVDENTAVRVGLRITDAPGGTGDALSMLADLTTGGLRFRAGPAGERPTLSFTLTHVDATTLLFGGQAERTRLFEYDGLRLEGAFLFVFFLDRLLTQDASGALAALRTRTAGLSAGPQRAGAQAARRPIDVPVDEAAAVRAAREVLPRTMHALDAELGSTTPGAQLYVSHSPSAADVSVAVGEARPGVPFARDSWPIWYCCSKAVGAVAVGRLWERGLVDPRQPVAAYLPWFEGGGREKITLCQLLMHTTPVPMALDPLHGSFAAPVALRREQLRTMVIPADALPGERINYAPWWAWFLLAEVVQAVAGRSYERFLAEEVLAPCAMTDTRVVLSPPEYREAADRLPLIHITGGGFPAQPTHWYATEAACTRPIPGLNMRGTMRDLGRFFTMLLAGGEGPGGRVLRPPTVAALTARHRVGLTDPFGNADWGLGFRVESRHLGEEYTAFSRYASLSSFGHYGLWTSTAFADPETGLVIALHLNGKTLQSEHQRRTLAICDAVYEDLGLS